MLPILLFELGWKAEGDHELRVEATAPGTCRFTQWETFSGVLVPVMRRLLDDTDTAFAAMNAALHARAAVVADTFPRDCRAATRHEPSGSARR
jgi:hypothetical protein